MTERKIFNIPSSNSFVDTIARKVLQQYKNNKLEMADVVIFVPNRRGAISLKDSFVREQGLAPTILPRIIPLGDLEEDEVFLTSKNKDSEKLLPAIDNTERVLIFTKIIMSKPSDFGLKEFSLSQAFSLAKELASLIDSVQNESLDFSGLKELVPEEYAAHWQETLKFLEIITSYWPQILMEREKIDAAQKHNLLLKIKSEQWEKEKPSTHIISAGIYADYPAVKNLLKTIYELPNGEIFIEGLDRNLNEEDWKDVGESHPQYQFKRLLEFIGITRAEVKDFTASENLAREKIVSEIMRPAQNTDKWLNLKNEEISREALEGIRLVSCENLRQEALAISLIMREHLEEKETTTALISTDRNLSRMVASELRRWDIEVDDSAGKPLHLSPVSIFLRQIFKTVADNFSAVSFLSLLKNPFCVCGFNVADFRKNVRDYEISVLRNKDKEQDGDIKEWANDIKKIMQPLAKLLSRKKVDLRELIVSHIKTAEILASSDTKEGEKYLWKGEDGRSCAQFLADLIEKSEILGDVNTDEYLDFIENAMSGISVRKQYGSHPRLKILGPVEARMNDYDYVILAEVNEGAWPPCASADPWMSRPMKQEFGLPLPEKNIGIFALDFANLLCKRNVYITRSERIDGAPVNKSRWWFRFETVLQAMGKNIEEFYENQYADWAKLIDRSEKTNRIEEPRPCPAVYLRPRNFSASSLSDLIDNPYVAYAKRILHLYPLDKLDEEQDARDYGNIVHKVLENFCNKYQNKLPENAERILLALGDEAFELSNLPENKKIFWKARFRKTIKWLVKYEEIERADVVKIVSENEGSMEINAPAGKVVLTARADRLDIHENKEITVVDYKTGSNVPSAKAVINYKAPQLLLEGLIVQKGGFQKVEKTDVSALKYWKLGEKEITVAGGDLAQIMLKGEEKLREIIGKYDFEEMPYVVNPAPKYCKDKNYEHLSRIREWGVSGEDGEEEENDEQ